MRFRTVRAGACAFAGLAIAAFTGGFASAGAATAAPASGSGFTALANSVSPTTDDITGSFSSSNMQIEVALAPSDPAGLSSELAALYDKSGASFEHWLSKGQFDAKYAPSAATTATVAKYLTTAGLTVTSSPSAFLVRATGTSAKVASAFRTTLSTFKDSHGVQYFANSTPVYVPTGLTSDVQGVIGLTNTVRNSDHTLNFNKTARAATKKPTTASCETPYPTTAQLFTMYVGGTSFPFGYGGGPGCSGLTPSQVNSLYGAPSAGARDKGAGVSIAVFELSAYQQSDIKTWTTQFYGSRYNPPLHDVTVDGGPLAPVCPAGDTCPPTEEGYAGDIEVDADIEAQLAVAPDVRNLLVYNAPNDETGQTELDEYTAIANADQADSISSSWGVCENDVDSAYVQAENVVFEQLAAQGQSVFSAAGDTGAFDCIRSDGTNIVNVDDPPSQPWVTSVGGTSFESDNPGTNPHPKYPAGVESVWNPDSLCSDAAPSAANDNKGGYFWCGATGAGGGGSSQYWGRPFYQRGPGVTSSDTTYANGSTHCSLAKSGTPCREVPDISADADQFTPYAEYCTGSASTPNSVCATFSGSQTPPGWFGIGGTSLSSPLWSAIIADRDGYQGRRSGNINPVLYLLYNLAPGVYFHDINGKQPTNNNGLFHTKPGYDLATGIGTPRMAALITGSL